MRRLLPLLLLCGLWLVSLSGAWGHAALLGSEPADGASLAQPPDRLVLRFDETVTPLDLRLAGPGGVTVLSHGTGQDSTTIGAPMPPRLPPGTYLASFRIISADGHPVSGAIAFGIGMAPERTVGAPTEGTIWTGAAEILRLALYLGFMLGAGGALFRAAVAPPPAAMLRWMQAGACAGILAAVLGIGVQGGTMLAASGPGALLQGGTWIAARASTVFARDASVALGLALVAIALGGRGTRLARLLGLAGAVLAAGGLSLSGHAATGGLPARLLLTLHALTAAFWLGAFLPLWALLRRDGAGALPAVQRFAAIAIPAVALLLLSGMAQAALHLPGPSALLETTYGLLLLAKAGGALLLLALAGLNHRRLTPALALGRPSAPSSLRRSIMAEAALATLVLATTAVLSMTSPHRAGAQDHHHPAPENGVTVATEAAGLSVTLQARPARAGPNRIDLWLARPDGAAFAAKEVWLEMSRPGAGIAGLRRPMREAAPGRFVLEGPELALPGDWTLRAEILLNDFEQADAVVGLPVAP